MRASAKRNIHTTDLIRYRLHSFFLAAYAVGSQTDRARCCMNCVALHLNSFLVLRSQAKKNVQKNLHIIAGGKFVLTYIVCVRRLTGMAIVGRVSVTLNPDVFEIRLRCIYRGAVKRSINPSTYRI